MATGLQGQPWVNPGAWAREGAKGNLCHALKQEKGEKRKRRMVSERLFANRASVNVEA